MKGVQIKIQLLDFVYEFIGFIEYKSLQIFPAIRRMFSIFQAVCS